MIVMREDEDKKREDQPERTEVPVTPPSHPDIPGGDGLIGEHDLGDAAEKAVDRNVHTKNTITGSDTDGQSA
jgi:hypothetical protein